MQNKGHLLMVEQNFILLIIYKLISNKYFVYAFDEIWFLVSKLYEIIWFSTHFYVNISIKEQ